MNKMRKAIAYLALTLAVFFLLASCSHHQATPEQAQGRFKTYKGVLNVYADAGLEPIIRQQKEVFEFYYDSVHVNIQYLDEPDAINAYRKNKTGVLILSRELDSTERVTLEKIDTLYTRQLPLAYDAVSLIGNKVFDDGKMDIDLLKKYFDPSDKSSEAPLLVFDRQSSGLVKYMAKSLGYGQQISGSLFAVKLPEDVISYVQQNKNAIGFIPFNFLSNTDNEKVRKINEQIKILSLHSVDTSGKGIRVSANQSDIAEGTYPFIRTITAVTHYGFADDLEWLLVYFLSKDKGSKIFLKDGLIPVRRTEREIIVNTDGLKASGE